jgi:hypothetical protein
MSWQIPQQIEQDIIAGKAQYRSFQTGVGGQSILPVPPNAYAVVFGYDFSPAGGGILFRSLVGTSPNPDLSTAAMRFFETQQISFYTGTDFFPFIHHVNSEVSIAPRTTTNPLTPTDTDVTTYQVYETLDSTPIARQVYITSDKDITISVGLIQNAVPNSTGAIPITNRTPALLTYGGSPQTLSVQTDFGPAVNPLQFMQPSPKDFQDFGFGLLPNNANGQAFATPDATNGLLDPSVHLNTIGGNLFRGAAAANYFLCLHYALYTRTIPEQRG